MKLHLPNDPPKKDGEYIVMKNNMQIEDFTIRKAWYKNGQWLLNDYDYVYFWQEEGTVTKLENESDLETARKLFGKEKHDHECYVLYDSYLTFLYEFEISALHNDLYREYNGKFILCIN